MPVDFSFVEIGLKNRPGTLPQPEPFGKLFLARLIADDVHLMPLQPPHIEPLTTLRIEIVEVP